MTEFKIDREYLRMIVDYYERKCPCWGGKQLCPCQPLAETGECQCGAIRSPKDVKAKSAKYESYVVDLGRLKNLANDHLCTEKGQTCFCAEFLEKGNCKTGVFQKSV